MKLVMAYMNFLDPEGRERRIGGVETYLATLADLAADMGWQAQLHQPGSRPFEARSGSLTVRGVVPRKSGRKEAVKAAIASARSALAPGDVLLFGADHVSAKVDWPRTVLLQHGISHDLPMELLTRRVWLHRGLAAALYKNAYALSMLRSYDNAKWRVCVDYNYPNWRRAVWPYAERGRTVVIPNFTRELANPEELELRLAPRPGPLRLLFARRFFAYRGTRLMADALERVFAQRPDALTATFAGEGPDEAWLKARFAGDARVRFIRYLPEELVKVLSEHDVSVVPSLASEGTSISLAEAMGMGLASVASAVGGMTNMVIDGFNGRLVQPNAEELTRALVALIDHPDERIRLARNGWSTARDAFSLDVWRARWRETLEQIATE